MKLFDQITVRQDSSIGGLDALAGKKIASTVASTDLQIAEDYAKDQLDGAKVVVYNNTNDCFLAVESRNVDACWLDVASTSTAIKDFPNLKVVGDPIPYVAVGSFAKDATANPYRLGAVGLVTNAKDGDLNLALSLAINEMVQDGTQQKILEKWELWGETQTDLVRSDA
jgi:ABC-type amino acid transport substrate-binding protein